MPYKVGGANLPKHVKSAPTSEQKIWVDAYDREWKKTKNEARSLEYANGVLKKIQGRTGPPKKEATKESVTPDTATQELIDEAITEAAWRELPDDLQKQVDALVESAEIPMVDIEEIITRIREARAMQTFDGVQYPAAAFAYAPDKEKPSTWKLPLWGPNMKPDRKRVAAAVAAFSSGGHRGKRVQIPAGDVAKVKAKIRAALRKFGVKDEDMKPHIKETQSRELLNEVLTIELSEGLAEGLATGTMPVRFLVPGLNTDKDRFYTEQAIQDACKVFEGVKMYANHPTRTEGRERPERDVRDWVANLRNCRIAPTGAAVGDAVIHESWFKAKVQGLLEAGELEGLGTSIIGVGSGTKGEVEKGVKAHIVENIVKGRSCDFVTEPGAGGRAGLQESTSATLYDEQNDIDLLNEADLRERRPDLVALIEEKKMTEARKDMEELDGLKAKVAELEESIATTEKERDELKDKIAEAELAQAKVTAQAEIKELVEAETEADLPEPNRKRLIAQFAEAASTEGVAEAIADQKALIAELRGTGDVTGLGRADPVDDTETVNAKLIEKHTQRFIRQGHSKEEAEQMARTFVLGR